MSLLKNAPRFNQYVKYQQTQHIQNKGALKLPGLVILIFSFLTLFSIPSFAANQSVFVSPQWLMQHQSNVKVIDMSEQANYQKFHIKNAIWVSYGWLIKPKNRVELSGGSAYMANVLSQLGIKNSDHIVIYDDMGGLPASRLYWELKKLNHKNVHILDGGIVSWVLAGNPVTQKRPVRPNKTNYQASKKDLTKQLTAYKNDVIQAKKDQVILIDARTKEEYTGNSKQPRSGHIPAALWFEWSNAVDLKNGFKQYPKETLLQTLRGMGVYDLNQPIIVYCNTAHRAARSFTMFKSLGFKHVKLYDGSIQEYLMDKSLPLKHGTRP
ncbi:rhodanese-like domain-containing protein [Thiomicrorhabdus hydrogeniphila]